MCDREQRLAEISEKYGTSVGDWARLKAEQEGEVPDEDRISKRISPSEPPPPPSGNRAPVSVPGGERTAPTRKA